LAREIERSCPYLPPHVRKTRLGNPPPSFVLCLGDSMSNIDRARRMRSAPWLIDQAATCGGARGGGLGNRHPDRTR
jgi:hypothetical protein